MATLKEMSKFISIQRLKDKLVHLIPSYAEEDYSDSLKHNTLYAFLRLVEHLLNYKELHIHNTIK